MRAELIDHAARLLRHVPTRCMDADTLYRRTRGDLGLRVSFADFLHSLHARPDRFAVLPSHLTLGDQRAWAGEELSAYEAALAQAGLPASPTVTLAERRPDARAAGAVSAAAASIADGEGPAATDPRRPREQLLGDVHTGLAELLHAGGDDQPLRLAISAALAELEAARHALETTS
jgi:hypothetical protein